MYVELNIFPKPNSSFVFVKETATATEEEQTETPATQKREDRLRKFRELHFKRVSCG